MPLDLYIQNERLERIGRVNVHGAVLQGCVLFSLWKSLLWALSAMQSRGCRVEKLVISTFTREPKVLGKTWGRLMRIVCEGDSKHFVGFGKYLHERGKVCSNSLRLAVCFVAWAPTTSVALPARLPKFTTTDTRLLFCRLLPPAMSGRGSSA